MRRLAADAFPTPMTTWRTGGLRSTGFPAAGCRLKTLSPHGGAMHLASVSPAPALRCRGAQAMPLRPTRDLTRGVYVATRRHRSVEPARWLAGAGGSTETRLRPGRMHHGAFRRALCVGVAAALKEPPAEVTVPGISHVEPMGPQIRVMHGEAGVCGTQRAAGCDPAAWTVAGVLGCSHPRDARWSLAGAVSARGTVQRAETLRAVCARLRVARSREFAG